MARIAVFITLDDEAIAAGWNDDLAELEGSIKATLFELNGDDGDVYQPHVLGIEVNDDE